MLNEKDFNLLKEVNLELFEEANRLKFRRKLSIASRWIASFLVIAIGFYGYNMYHMNQDLDSKLQQYGDDAYCYMCSVKAYKSCDCVIIPPMTTYGKEYFETIGTISAETNCRLEASKLNKNNKGTFPINFTFNYTP